jgi:hypothetical protein
MSCVPISRHSYDSHIQPHEYFWVDHQPFLLSCGYMLRPRYHPAWVPSWKLAKPENMRPFNCEDGSGLLVSTVYSFVTLANKCLTNAAQKDHVLDATRVTDGVKVVLKRVHSDGDEVQIALHLSSVEMSSDPRNRTVPILDVITLPDDKYVLLVMPYLRIFNTPPFHCRGEVVEALRQLLQV